MVSQPANVWFLYCPHFSQSSDIPGLALYLFLILACSSAQTAGPEAFKCTDDNPGTGTNGGLDKSCSDKGKCVSDICQCEDGEDKTEKCSGN